MAGCIIGVLGGKGGVGKSVFAANLALTYRMEVNQPVLLIDADARSCGDQNVITGIKPNMILQELSKYKRSLKNLSPAQQSTIWSLHERTGMAYIGAVRSAEESLQADPDLLQAQILSLSHSFPFIIIDLGCELGDVQMSLIEICSSLHVVSTLEILVMNQTRKLLLDLMSATVPKENFHLVVNQFTNNHPNANTLLQSLGLSPFGFIPRDDIGMHRALQESQPVVLSQPSAATTRAYKEMVRKFIVHVLPSIKKQSGKGGKLFLKRKSHDSADSFSHLGASSASSRGQGQGQVSRQGGSSDEKDPAILLKSKIHNELIKAMDLKRGIADTQGDPQKEKVLRQKTLQSISTLLDREASDLPRDQRSRFIKEILDEALGLGPLEDLLADPRVTEIMVNGCHCIFIEKGGKLTLSPVRFTSNLHLRNIIERIVTPLGRRIDEKIPYVDARLADGSRVNAIIEPLSIDGPSITIRKFAKEAFTADMYLNYKSMNSNMVDFLKIGVENGLNIIVSGGTGSGKTTLLNVLSSFIPSNERIVTVEDAAELQLKQNHVVRLETRPASIEGTGQVTIRDLVRNSLRMRPDRIIVGECRDGAALDMLSAMNTGHDGSMTTTHANSPRECLSRLETLCMMAGMELPVQAIREQISSAVHLIVQISRLGDGSRKIISVTEVVGMQGDKVTLQEVFAFKETGFDKNRKIQGAFQATGLIPSFIEKIEQKGIAIPRTLFSNEERPQGEKQGRPGGGAQAVSSSKLKPTATLKSFVPLSRSSFKGPGPALRKPSSPSSPSSPPSPRLRHFPPLPGGGPHRPPYHLL